MFFQAFTELQGKLQETNQKLRIADVQVDGLKKQITHAQLTDKEIQVTFIVIFLSNHRTTLCIFRVLEKTLRFMKV